MAKDSKENTQNKEKNQSIKDKKQPINPKKDFPLDKVNDSAENIRKSL